MGRLSNDRKRDIVDSESNKKFYDKIAESEKLINQETEKLANKTIPKWYTEEAKNSKMVQTTNSAEIFWDGCEDDEDYNEYDKSVCFSLNNRYPSEYGRSLRFEASKTLISRRKKYLAITGERDEFEMKLKRVLQSVNTDKKLIEHLPELTGYAEVSGTMSTALMPIESIKEIRGLLASA